MNINKIGTITLDTKILASDSIYGSEIAEEAVFLEPDEGMYYGLNKPGAAIWQYLKQPIAVSELCRLVAEKYDPGSADIEAMVLEFVRELLVAKMIKAVD